MNVVSFDILLPLLQSWRHQVYLSQELHLYFGICSSVTDALKN